jgi:hypothetical protein
MDADANWAIGYASCPVGKKPLGGGGYIFGATDAGAAIWASFPSNDDWVVEASAPAGTTAAWSLKPYAVCAASGSS